ncbi:MAG TPA: MarR family winged helix-turn-helix transcriptional regulator [Cellvibrionaceae bacterium]|nr:MarR family winged helix-turn-helix transcriptional regulator [Cellvibrionaceae bacterium]
MKNSKNINLPSSLDSHIGFWLRLVSNQVSARFRALVETQAGCSVSEWVALRVLYDQPACTHGELIDSLGMTKGATSKVISRLEAQGLVKRVLAAGSNREQLIVLTTAGKKLVPRLAALADENDSHFFATLSAAEKSALMAALQKLVAPHHPPGPPID